MGISAPGESWNCRIITVGEASEQCELRGGAQHHPEYSLDEAGLSFSLGACEECRFVQASADSSTADFSVLSILHRRNYPDLYPSYRRELFLLSHKLGQVEGHCRCFAFPTRAGGMQREAQRFTGRSPGRVLGKKVFLHACLPALS